MPLRRRLNVTDTLKRGLGGGGRPGIEIWPINIDCPDCPEGVGVSVGSPTSGVSVGVAVFAGVYVWVGVREMVGV